MRRKAHFWLYYKSNDEFKEFFEKFKGEILEFKLSSSFFDFKIYKDSNGYEYLMKQIESLNARYSFWETREYTKKEIENSELFFMQMIYPWQNSPRSAEDFGTRFDNNTGCSLCGREKKQTSKLSIDIKKIERYDIATIVPEIFISERLRSVLEVNNVTGVRFGDVEDYKGRDTSKYYQLFIDNILPSMSDRINVELREAEKCKVCGNGGVYLKSEIIYNKSDLLDIRDVNLTNEYLWGYGVRQVIISSKVRDLFKINKCKVGYEPIEIIY